MSRINSLIARLAPNGAPFRPLGTLGIRNQGTSITASKMKTLSQVPGPIRVFAGGNTIADVAEDAIPATRIVRVPSIIVKSRGHIGFTYYEKPFTHKSELWSYSINDDSIDQKFVYYYLLTQVEKLQGVARATSVKLPQLSVRDTDTLKVPLPPLEVQQEIVRILDNFTQLEAELEAELEARLLQYAYYRDDLLSFDASVPRLTLGDLGAFFGGLSGKTKADFAGGNARFASYRNVFSNPALDVEANDFVQVGETEFQRSLQLGDVILTGSSESFEEVGMSSVVTREPIGKMYLNSFSIGFRLNNPDILDPVYSKHLFRSRLLRKQIIKAANGVTRINLSKKLLSRVVVPVPSLDVQKRVGETLESFSSLIHDMEIGLPAEIAARRKQYEYYRDKLLTFEEAS